MNELDQVWIIFSRHLLSTGDLNMDNRHPLPWRDRLQQGRRTGRQLPKQNKSRCALWEDK